MMNLPKRLIEVDLPIKKISEQARREKSIRHGHISTLHIWWARRPLAACRAVLCACLWPDPADPLCPPEFQKAAAGSMKAFRDSRGGAVRAWDDPLQLRRALLDFIADFSNWDNSTVPEYLKTARDLTQAAHEALGGAPGTRPLVVDPFAGGGSIPLEALRIGADAFASDLNPVAVLLNKVVLEYIPKYGQQLADEVRKWGTWIKEEAEKELAPFYPKDPDGAVPIAYLWARTIQCEGPGCGAEVPLIRSLWLAKKDKRKIALRMVPRPRAKRVDFEIIEIAKEQDVAPGTVRRGSASCPCCGYTTPVSMVRMQLSSRAGGAADARLLCVVTSSPDSMGRRYRLPTSADLAAIQHASGSVASLYERNSFSTHRIPNEPIPEGGSRTGGGSPFTVFIYGMRRWKDLFAPRQLVALTKLSEFVRQARSKAQTEADLALAEAVQAILALVVDRVLVRCTANCIWDATTLCIMQIFNQGQSLPVRWEFAEMIPIAEEGSGWGTSLEYTLKVLDALTAIPVSATVELCSATSHPLPDDSALAFITDPPYYDAIPYSDLSDFFYVWLKRNVPATFGCWFSSELTKKEEECVVDLSRAKDHDFFSATMRRAMSEGRRILDPSGIGMVVFAHKSTSGWEAQIQAIVDAGWTVTASWPIDTESGNRLRAKGSAALASSVHIVLRPRENPDGSVRQDVGDWGDVISELPKRIHEWMPRLAEEGVVGADAIFSCLGPALEVFSRYSRVERADGSAVTLREYLEHVWAAVSREALRMVLQDADTAGLEPDARLTAIWLWTLSDSSCSAPSENEQEELTAEADEEGGVPSKKLSGFTLEFDAARKIAQGLGARLEELTGVVEVKGETARLLPISERVRILFGKREETKSSGKKSQKKTQLSLFQELEEAAEEQGWDKSGSPKPGLTVLDRLHQAMILFADNRTTALKRFLVEEGAGQDARLWKLAQALSALYPAHGEEKRWVDGVLARKKALGF